MRSLVSRLLPDLPAGFETAGARVVLTVSRRPRTGTMAVTLRDGCILGLGDDRIRIQLSGWQSDMFGASRTNGRLYERWLSASVIPPPSNALVP